MWVLTRMDGDSKTIHQACVGDPFTGAVHVGPPRADEGAAKRDLGEPGYFAVRIENTPPALRPNYARQLELDAFGSAEALRTHLWQGTLTSACDDVSHVAGQGTWGVSIVAMVPREGELEPVVVAHQSFETEVKAAESRDDMAVLAGLAHVRLHFPERYQGKTPQQAVAYARQQLKPCVLTQLQVKLGGEDKLGKLTAAQLGRMLGQPAAAREVIVPWLLEYWNKLSAEECKRTMDVYSDKVGKP